MKQNRRPAMTPFDEKQRQMSSQDIEADEHDDDLETTASVRQRWWATNDLLGGILLLSLPAIIIGAGAQILTLAPVPEIVIGTYLIVVGTATVWMFGVDSLRAWRGE